MALHASVRGAAAPFAELLTSDTVIGADLESALVAGLPEPAEVAFEEWLEPPDGSEYDPVPLETVSDAAAGSPGVFDTAAIGADLESALVAGLAEPAGEASEEWLEPPGGSEYDSVPLETVSDAAAGSPGVFDTAAIGADLESALVAGLAEPAGEASEEWLEPPGGSEYDSVPLEVASDAAAGSAGVFDTAAIGTDLESALVAGLGEPAGEASEERLEPLGGSEFDSVPLEAASDAAADSPGVFDTAAVDADLESALVAGLGEPAGEASEERLEPPGGLEFDSLPLEAASDAATDSPGVFDTAAVDADLESALVGEFDRPVAAFAFAMDLDTENALREGLFDYEGPSANHDEPQVWSGGLHAAIKAIAAGHTTPLILVDIDGISYPAGGLYELAAFCEVDTVVIAIGSNATAQTSRELLLAGVSDYLVKPITAAAIREAVARVTAPVSGTPREGCVAGFIGAGGSGTTTLVVATALHVANRGRYVSILDLNRTHSPIALMLDVEPKPGLEQLLEAANESSLDPALVDTVCVERSERVAVYAYPASPLLPPVPQKPAVNCLLAQLRRRSQFVFVDGIDDSAFCLDLLADVDARVLVFEPTARGAKRAARVVDLLDDIPPVVLVQNHTRAFRRGAATQALCDAGMETQSDVVVPFEPALPKIGDWGWPRSRLPRPLLKPLTALTDQLLV